MRKDELINGITEADAAQIDDILDAVIRRKRVLYPDWEIIYYAGKKNEPEDLDRIFQLIRKNSKK